MPITPHHVKQLLEIVKREGWMGHPILVQPPFYYTCGINARFNLPDIMICGIQPSTIYPGTSTPVVHMMAVSYVRMIVENGVLLKEMDGFLWTPAQGLIAKPLTYNKGFWEENFGIGCQVSEQLGIMNEDYRMIQLFWPDKNDLFPWQPGYRVPPEVQPDHALSTSLL